MGCQHILKEGRGAMNMLKSFLADKSGASAIEYGLISALIAIVMVVLFGLVGIDVDNIFSDMEAQLVTQSQLKIENNN